MNDKYGKPKLKKSDFSIALSLFGFSVFSILASTCGEGSSLHRVLEDLANRFHQFVRPEGFGNKLDRPQLKHICNRLLGRVTAHDNDGYVGPILLNLPHEIYTIMFGHLHIHEKKIEIVMLNRLEALVGTGDRRDLKTLCFEDALTTLGHDRIVINH